MKSPNRILAEDLDGILAAPLPWAALRNHHILISGASGFIGGHIVETLVWLNRLCPEFEMQIHALARDLDKLRRRLPWLDIPGDITPVIQDVTRPLRTSIPFGFIIHAASPASPCDYLHRPVDTILANTSGTLGLLELARQHQARFLFLSSGAVYGENTLGHETIGEDDFGGENPLAPRACYSESKRLAETLCHAYHTQYGLDARIARISHCYGPGMRLDDGRAIAHFLASVLQGRDIQLDSDGSASRPFCYVSDTVQGLFHILLRGEAGHAYNLGATQETTILELARHIIAAAGQAERLTVHPLARSAPAPAARSSGHFNIDKIGQLGWAPRTRLQSGLARMLTHYACAKP